NAEIDGYVGDWDKEKGLQGIYLTPNIEQYLYESNPNAALLRERTVPVPSAEGKANKHYIYSIEPEYLEESLKPLKNIDNWKTIPIAGDYDSHDMISMSGRPHPITQGTQEEAF